MKQKITTRALAVAAATLLSAGAPAAAQRVGTSGDDSAQIDSMVSDAMTREELVGLYGALLGGETTLRDCVAGEERFDDVPFDNPFCPWIEELARRGITEGCDDNNYCPGDPVSRLQMAVFLVRSIDRPIVTGDVREEVPPGEIVSAHAVCPEGTRLISGGGSFGPQDALGLIVLTQASAFNG